MNMGHSSGKRKRTVVSPVVKTLTLLGDPPKNPLAKVNASYDGLELDNSQGDVKKWDAPGVKGKVRLAQTSAHDG